MNVLRLPLLDSDRFCWRLEDLMKTESLGVEYIFSTFPLPPSMLRSPIALLSLWSSMGFFLIPKKSNMDRPGENLNVLE